MKNLHKKDNVDNKKGVKRLILTSEKWILSLKNI